jgi:hypothetical protein
MASLIPQINAEKEGLISEAVVNAEIKNRESADELKKSIASLKTLLGKCSNNRWDIRRKIDLQKEIDRKNERLRDLTTSKEMLRSKYERIEAKYSNVMKTSTSKLVSTSIHSSKSMRKSNIVLMSPENSEECMRQHLRADLGLQETPLMLSAGDVCDTCGIQMTVVNNDSMLTCSICHKLRLLPNSMTTSALHGTDVESSAAITKHRLPEWIEMAQGKEFSEPSEDVIETVAKFMITNNMSGLEDFADIISLERENGPFLGVVDAIRRLHKKIPDIEERLKNINSNTIRTALKGIVVNGKAEKFRKFYERSTKLSALISGFWPPRMTGQQEEHLRLLYTVAAPEYEKRRKPKQTYWPGGFPFFLRCLCVLLGWDEFAAQFPTTATKEGGTRDLLRNEIWSELGWELVPFAGQLPPIKFPDGSSRSINLEDEDAEQKSVRKEVETKISIKKRARVDFELECS